MTEPLPKREDALIAMIGRLAQGLDCGNVRVGIGDDAAVIVSPPSNLDILVTTDQIIENTHFVMGLHPPEALGKTALVRGVSDVAAMGGGPSWFTLSLGVPQCVDFHWMEQFLRGMFSEISTIAVQGFTLVGGDIARAPFFTAHVTVAGTAPRGKALLRSAARPGDRLFVSGRLGGSALGLERLLGKEHALDDSAIQRHIHPAARLGLGRWLLDAGVAACMDVSDGLSRDVGRLALASRVSIVIEAASVPQFPEAGIERALHGGEEYELLFTAPRGIAIPDRVDGLELTSIGRVEEGAGLWLEDESGRRLLEPRGFEHFNGD